MSSAVISDGQFDRSEKSKIASNSKDPFSLSDKNLTGRKVSAVENCLIKFERKKHGGSMSRNWKRR
jgi:hypothetical protein